jgi:hypothetical protein
MHIKYAINPFPNADAIQLPLNKKAFYDNAARSILTPANTFARTCIFSYNSGDRKAMKSF